MKDPKETGTWNHNTYVSCAVILFHLALPTFIGFGYGLTLFGRLLLTLGVWASYALVLILSVTVQYVYPDMSRSLTSTSRLSSSDILDNHKSSPWAQRYEARKGWLTDIKLGTSP